MDSFEKTETAVLDFDFDFTAHLNGETIDSTAFSVPTGITLDSSRDDGSVATAVISGGTLGEAYELTCKANYTKESESQNQDLTIEIVIVDKYS